VVCGGVNEEDQRTGEAEEYMREVRVSNQQYRTRCDLLDKDIEGKSRSGVHFTCNQVNWRSVARDMVNVLTFNHLRDPEQLK